MRHFLIAGCLLFTALGANAAFEPDPELARTDLPPDRNGPVPVEVNFFLLDVNSVNGATETFTASVYLDIKWKDSRMAFDAAKFGDKRIIFSGDGADTQLQTMWSPEVSPANLTGDPQVEDKALTIYADGTVEYETRIQGEFHSSMILTRFPFDQQKLHIHLESFLWDATEVKLVQSVNKAHFNEKLSMRDWTAVSMRAFAGESVYVTGDRYSRFTAEVVVNRQPWFYIWGVIFPLILVTVFGLTCFLWDQETLTERVAQALTCLLTVTAQSLAVSGDLPRISYFTPIDYAFMLTYIVLMIVTMESIYVKMLNEEDKAHADRVDMACAIWVTFGYALGMLAVFVIPMKW